MFKKAIDQSGLPKAVIEHLAGSDVKAKRSTSGIAGDVILDPIPKYVKSPSEKVIDNGNSFIVLGRDRVGSRLSGYGGSGDTQCSSIDIVVGRQGFEARKVSAQGQQLWTDPSFKRDAARIYMSQKTDVDKAFGLADGGIGNVKTRSAIALKADELRFIARGGIKLVTRTDIKNSQGGRADVVNGITLLAGNSDEGLSPMVKGDNMVAALERITVHVDKLNGILDSVVMIMVEFNIALTSHFHSSPFWAAPTSPSTVLIGKGIKANVDLLTKCKKSLVSHKINLVSFKQTYLKSYGRHYVLSRYHKLN